MSKLSYKKMQLLSYFHRRNDRFVYKTTTFSLETIAHEHTIICVQNIDLKLRMRKRYSALSGRALARRLHRRLSPQYER